MNWETPKSYQKLIKQFLKFPTVGPKTAARFVSYLVHQDKKEVENLVKSIQDLEHNIKLCSFCFNPFEGKEKLCPICENNSRNNNILCVVEKEIDLMTIQETKKYKGLYFILGGTVSKLRKKDIKKLRVEELTERIKNPKKFGISNNKIEEVIVATNPTTEGEATAALIEKEIRKLSSPPKITYLARGLPKGGELEYADKETLGAAFEGRK